MDLKFHCYSIGRFKVFRDSVEFTRQQSTPKSARTKPVRNPYEPTAYPYKTHT